MANFVQVVTAIDDDAAAEQLSAGHPWRAPRCGRSDRGPIKSLYWWHGKLEDAPEWQLIMKTTSDRLAMLEEY